MALNAVIWRKFHFRRRSVQRVFAKVGQLSFQALVKLLCLLEIFDGGEDDLRCSRCQSLTRFRSSCLYNHRLPLPGPADVERTLCSF